MIFLTSLARIFFSWVDEMVGEAGQQQAYVFGVFDFGRGGQSGYLLLLSRACTLHAAVA